MKKEFHCPRCGQPSGTNANSSRGQLTCLRCGLVHTVPRATNPPAADSSCYQLSPMAVSPLTGQPREQATPPSSAPRRARSSRTGWLRYVRPWAIEASHVQGIGAWLVLLSAADLLMTFVLLRRSELFFESNPIAQWFFEQWNITGMVFFKFSMIGGVILMSEIIERKRPGWGRFVLLVGCVGAAFAVLQGGRLYLADSARLTFGSD